MWTDISKVAVWPKPLFPREEDTIWYEESCRKVEEERFLHRLAGRDTVRG